MVALKEINISDETTQLILCTMSQQYFLWTFWSFPKQNLKVSLDTHGRGDFRGDNYLQVFAYRVATLYGLEVLHKALAFVQITFAAAAVVP